MTEEKYQCVVKVCGNRKNKIVGAIWWKTGYMPFAIFYCKEDPRIFNEKIIKPTIIGTYKQIEFCGVDDELKAVDPVWIADIEVDEDKQDKEVCFFDLTIYESWLRKNKLPIPEPVDPELFISRIRAERSKGLFKIAQSKITVL